MQSTWKQLSEIFSIVSQIFNLFSSIALTNKYFLDYRHLHDIEPIAQNYYYLFFASPPGTRFWYIQFKSKNRKSLKFTGDFYQCTNWMDSNGMVLNGKRTERMPKTSKCTLYTIQCTHKDASEKKWERLFVQQFSGTWNAKIMRF